MVTKFIRMRTICKLLMIVLLAIPVAAEDKGATKERLVGQLVIPKGANTKDSFQTGNFQLLGAKQRYILVESAKVDEATLKKFRQQFVEVEVEFLPATKADPNLQAPVSIDPSGKRQLQDHPPSYRVVRISPYSGKAFPVVKD